MARLMRIFPLVLKTNSQFCHPTLPRIVFNNPRWIFGFSGFDRQVTRFSDPHLDFFDRNIRRIRNEMLQIHQNISQEFTEPSIFRNFFGRRLADMTPDNLVDYIHEENGVKKLKIQFDLSSFKPEDIEVKTVKNKLLVTAKMKQESDNRSLYQEYTKEYSLPAGVDPLTITSNLSENGLLLVEAPYNPPENEEKPTVKEIPVKHE